MELPQGIEIRNLYSISDQEKITKQLIELDKECFEHISEEDEGSFSQWTTLQRSCVGQVLFDTHKNIPIGYIDFVVFNEQGINALYDGSIQDGNLSDYAVGTIPTGLPVDIYLVCIAIKREYRGKGLATILWNHARANFDDRNIYVKAVYGVIWTKEGELFLANYKPKMLRYDTQGHQIMCITCPDGKLPLKA